MKSYKIIKGLTLFSILCVSSMTISAETKIHAQIFKMPEVVETAAVTTAGHYILSSHLVRPILKLDKFGKIQSDIGLKWEHSVNLKIWTITIGSEKFSNGEPITVNDIVQSIKRQMKFKTGVHFPFSEIVNVTEVSSTMFQVELKHPRNDFIYDLTKPEFGVLHKTDYSLDKNLLKFVITSGAYSLEKKENSTYYLTKNVYFKSDVKNTKDLIIESSDGEKSSVLLKEKTINFLSTQQNLSLDGHQRIINNHSLAASKPHVAFSYWLSLNPNSSVMSDSKLRTYFQSFISEFKGNQIEGHSWERSNQLYLPDGEGRPSAEALKEAWANINKNSKFFKPKSRIKLRILPLKVSNSLLDELLDYIRTDFDIEIIPYTTELELVDIIKSNKFDIKISSNDFSSIDLSENLKTTFNASRPYIFLNKTSPIKGLLKQAIEIDNKEKRSELFKKIGIILITEGLIAPLAYQRIWFYYNKSFDISAWSSFYPEISFWKVKISE